MIRFVNGSRNQYQALAEMLEDGNCHVFKACELPAGTRPDVARIGFEKTETGYKVLIDRNIETSANSAAFRQFLRSAEKEFPSIEDVQAFFADFSPLFETSDTAVDIDRIEQLQQEKTKRRHITPDKIADPLKTKIFGQDPAIDKLAHEISAHLIAPADRPLVLSFLGPCGVGKSETGRSLSEVMSIACGETYGFICEAGNTIKGEHAVQKFLGAPPSYVGYGDATFFDPVRKNPYHIILIDEIEKAHPVLLIALMEALDTGFLSMNDNSPKIDLRHSIIIFTSNLPVNMAEYALLDDFKKTTFCRDLFTKFTEKPEIARRISDFIVYNELNDRARINIILGYIRDELANFNATLGKADDELILSFLTLDSRYGASALRSFVRKALSFKLIETADTEAFSGKKLKLSGTYETIKVEAME